MAKDKELLVTRIKAIQPKKGASSIDIYPIEEPTENFNQFVYDLPDAPDFVVNVTEVYFARQVPAYVWKEKRDTYTVKGSGTLQDVKKVSEKQLTAKKIKFKEVNASAEAKEVYSKGDVINLVWQEEVQKGITYEKIDSASDADKIYLIAECYGQTGKLTLSLHELITPPNKLILHRPVKFLVNSQEKTEVTFAINGRSVYALEVQLRPQSESELKTIIENLDARMDKSTLISIKAKVTDTRDKILFNWRSYTNIIEADYLTEEKKRFQLLIKQNWHDPIINPQLCLYS